MKHQHSTSAPDTGKKNLVWMSVIYLLGLFIGAIDTGIVTPARPIIQSQLGVDANLGIWMITIYTLTYAAIIPIAGKLADKRGRKPIYLLSIALFGIGSLICALSAGVGSFAVLMLGRVVQACGGGGIMPVATAEFGTSFPEEKRGMALGLVGAVYGIANVLGASAGSLVLDIAGADRWQWIFLINVPICVFIVIAGIVKLPNNKAEVTKAMDKLGTLLMTLIILSLLYGLKNLDFFHFGTSFITWQVWPFIALSVVLIPVFVAVEKRAEDPIFHIEYAANRQIMVTLALGVVVGCSMMGMIFIPQFSENCLRLPSGSGGYFVIILGVCSGMASMMSGKLIDKKGAKLVMALGFIVTILGCLYLGFVAVKFMGILNVILSLVVIGFGLGLTMGTPLNYMMLQNTSDAESNSALATLSLVRSIGTAVAPAIMVGFIVHAASGLQTGLMDILPKEATMPQLPYAQEIDATLDKYADTPMFSMGDMEMPRLSEMTTIEVQMSGEDGGSYEMPADVLERIQNSDVTTITENTVYLVETMFNEMSPMILENITSGIDAGIKGINQGLDAMSGMGNLAAMGEMPAAMGDMANMMGGETSMPAEMPGTGMPDMSAMGKMPATEEMSAMGSMGAAVADMQTLSQQLSAVRDAVPEAFAEATDNYLASVKAMSDEIEDMYQATVNTGYRNMYIFVAVVNVLGLALLSLYKEKKKGEQ